MIPRTFAEILEKIKEMNPACTVETLECKGPSRMNLPEATKAINAILRELEQDTQMIVETIELKDIDVTGMTDQQQILHRSVLITLKRLPGINWMN